MKILRTEIRQCPSCMEEHEVQIVEVAEDGIKYIYEYCTNTEEFWQTEEMLQANTAAYRKKYPPISEDIVQFMKPIVISGEAAENFLRSLAEDDARIEQEEIERQERMKNAPPLSDKESQDILKKLIQQSREKDPAYLREKVDMLQKKNDNLRRRLFLCKRDNRTDKDKLKNDIAKAKQFHLTDSDIWDLDDALAELILPNLIRFKKANTHSHPIMYDEDLHGLNHREAWEKALDDMIYSFQEAVNEYDYGPFVSIEETKKYGEKVQAGFVLFGKYFCHLWD